MIFSRTFAIGDSKEIGLYEVPMHTSLLGLGNGTILANFHTCGMMLLFNAMLRKSVRYLVARGPRCFRC